MPRKKRHGKPGPKPREDRATVRTLQLRVPVTEAEHARAMALAAAAGVSVAELIRAELHLADAG